MTLAVDYAWARPDPAATRRAGYSAAVRYLSNDSTKDISAVEAAALHAAGLGVGVVWETLPDRALAGAAAGTVDGVSCRARLEALGYPPGAVVWVNVGDFAATPAEIAAIDAYYQRFIAAIEAWTPGGYGTGFIIDRLAGLGRRGLWWQNAMNDNGEAGAVVSNNAALYQRVAATVTISGATPGSYDENVVLKPIPWWTPTTPTPAPPPLVPTSYPIITGGPMPAVTVRMPVGATGEGWAVFDGGTNSDPGSASLSPAVPFAKFVSLTAWSVDPAHDKPDSPLPQLGVQDRGGHVFVKATGAQPGSASTVGYLVYTD